MNSAAPRPVERSPDQSPSAAEPRPLNRVREVRAQQGVSLRSAARRLKVEPAAVTSLEDEMADIRLSTLYKWSDVLDVPVSHLLVDEDDPLTDPVLKRARMVRVMKTAATILEKEQEGPLHVLARRLVDQLVEIMPELAVVAPWHAVGQRRSLDECGRVAERTVPDRLFSDAG